MRALLAIALVICTAGASVAEAPKTSLRPVPRPIAGQPLADALPFVSIAAALPLPPKVRPMRRPDAVLVAAPDKPRTGLLGLLKPRGKPAKPAKRAAVSRKGSVCGDPSIKGRELPRITAEIKGCGVDDPVSVTSVDGVQLSQAATLDCTTARALNSWVQKGLRPAFRGNDIVQLQIAAHYTCRSRNNVRGAKISEHGRGKAIDISGIVFANGEKVTVEQDFNRSLRKAYKAGCGIFATTLGPGSDGYHEDHMHFDTAKHRSGVYCR